MKLNVSMDTTSGAGTLSQRFELLKLDEDISTHSQSAVVDGACSATIAGTTTSPQTEDDDNNPHPFDEEDYEEDYEEGNNDNDDDDYDYPYHPGAVACLVAATAIDSYPFDEEEDGDSNDNARLLAAEIDPHPFDEEDDYDGGYYDDITPPPGAVASAPPVGDILADAFYETQQYGHIQG
jgi:hypothetical protein